MTGPCLCGDPACGSCFPGGQTRLICPACGWQGRGYEVFEDDTCPECGDAKPQEQDSGNFADGRRLDGGPAHPDCFD